MFHISIVHQLLDMCFANSSHSDLAKKSIALGVITSCFLISIKLGAWLLTNSLSMQASMNDSILDAMSSFLAYHALAFAAVKFDKNHNYGHEKVEGLMAIFQCLVVVYSGYVICREAYESFLDPTPVANSGIGIVIMIMSCIAVYQLLYFQRYVAEKTESLLVKGDSLHYLSDFFMNICIIASLIISKYFAHVDAICGVIVGVYVLYNAILIIKNALIDLMDEALPEDTRKAIMDSINAIDGVQSVKRLRTRSAGMKKYVDASIIVDKHLTIVDADTIATNTEKAIHTLFANVDVVVKAEPEL